MSHTSSSQEEQPDFADFLVRYPGLAAWLSHALQSQDEPKAEALLPSFLAECASQGVPDSAYPFTAADRGLADLQSYLQAAQSELNAFATAPTPHEEVLTNEQADIADLPTQHVASLVPTSEEEDVADLPTQHVAALSPSLESVPEDTEQAIVAQENSRQAIDVRDAAAEPVLSEDSAAEPVALEDGKSKSTEGEARQLVAPLGVLTSSWRRKRQGRRPRTRRQRILSWALLLLILAAVLVPGAFLVSFGVSAYTTYRSLSDEAHGAVNQLLDVKKIFSADKSHPNAIFDPVKLRQAQQDFVASGHDFQQLQNQLKQSGTINTITSYFPQYRTTLSSALAASVMGVDVAKIGQIATTNVLQIAPSLNGPLLASSGKPLITQPVLETIGTILDQVSPLLNDIQAQSPNISLGALPISASEKSQVGQLLQMLPQVITDLGQVRSILGDAGWLLGVDQPRTFLVQTMDRAELRAAGGFTGQYGELKVNGGRIAPFSLTDIGQLEYAYGSATQGQLAPEPYRSWWPFPNWGLRDSNVSADFPTTAQVALSLYQEETGHQVDGLISFTPTVIEHILSVIGPIQVPSYDTTVTAQNLENLLHYYQLDNGGIRKQILVSQANGANAATSARKQFTSYVTTLLMDKVRSASPNELLSIANQVFADLKTKDLQIYFNDPAVEKVLIQHGDAGQLDRSTTHDGLAVVQENLSANKASQYVQTIMHDTVTLNNQGGATHQLQIRLVYNQAGSVYGYDTYYDYLRVYVPANSQLLSGDGFSSGIPLCGGSYGVCPVNGVYPGGELTCPAGQYQPGAMPPSFADLGGGDWRPLQTIGAPTNTLSDEPGRAMYGGWVIVPKNCTMNVTLSWYVPPMAQHGYSLLVQRQAGTFPDLDLSILPNAADCAQLATAGMHFDGILTEDASFTLPTYKPVKQGTQSCYPRSGV